MSDYLASSGPAGCIGFLGNHLFFEDDISQEPGLTMMSAWENVGPACLENG